MPHQAQRQPPKCVSATFPLTLAAGAVITHWAGITERCPWWALPGAPWAAHLTQGQHCSNPHSTDGSPASLAHPRAGSHPLLARPPVVCCGLRVNRPGPAARTPPSWPHPHPSRRPQHCLKKCQCPLFFLATPSLPELRAGPLFQEKKGDDRRRQTLGRSSRQACSQRPERCRGCSGLVVTGRWQRDRGPTPLALLLHASNRQKSQKWLGPRGQTVRPPPGTPPTLKPAL